jgi:peptidyl-prolyl cis-trans isomerase C
MLRNLALLGFIAPVALMAASSGSGPMPATTNVVFSSPVLAKGRAVSVTRSDLDEELIRIKTAYAAQGRTIQTDSPMVERQVLDSLVNRDLLMLKVTAEDRAKGREQFESSLQRFKTNGGLTEEEFNQKLNQQLQIMGLTKKQWELQGIEQASLPVMLERELKANPTDEQAKKYFDENPAKFERPEMVRAAHILLMTSDPATRKDLSDEQKAAKKKQMEAILKRARAGEDFGKLAKEYSEDPGSKDKGGEYTFPRGQMMPEFEAAAFSLNTNQVSDIITTPYGYHIIKLYEKIPAKKLEFDKVKDDLKEALTQQALQKQIPGYMAKLEKDANVEILDEKLKPAETNLESEPVVEATTNSAPAKAESN